MFDGDTDVVGMLHLRGGARQMRQRIDCARQQHNQGQTHDGERQPPIRSGLLRHRVTETYVAQGRAASAGVTWISRVSGPRRPHVTDAAIGVTRSYPAWTGSPAAP